MTQVLHNHAELPPPPGGGERGASLDAAGGGGGGGGGGGFTDTQGAQKTAELLCLGAWRRDWRARRFHARRLLARGDDARPLPMS